MKNRREQGARSREQGAGSREQGAGSRKQGAGSRELRVESWGFCFRLSQGVRSEILWHKKKDKIRKSCPYINNV